MLDKSDGLGLRLFKSLLDSKKVEVLEKLKIEDFLPGKVRDMFAWILHYRLTYNNLPTEIAFIDEFGSVLPPDIEDLTYLHEQILKRNLGFKLTQNLEKVAGHLDNNDPDAALTQLIQVTQSLSAEKPVQITSYKQAAAQRIQKYKDNLANQVFDGIETPWQEVNDKIQGWMNGTLNVILGRPNTGKSWWLCIVGDDCLTKNKSALFVTLEMPSSRIIRRLDALRHKLSFGKLRNLKLSPDELKKWEDSVAAEKTSADIIVLDKQQIRTVTDTVMAVKKYKPDIVLIDGGYRFTGRSKSQWENTVEIVNDLQVYAEETNIPWLVTNQYGELKEDTKKNAPTDKMSMSARYGGEWVINPDIVIGIQQSPDDRVLHKMQVHILKERDSAGETDLNQFHINWDLIGMNFDSSKSILDNSVGVVAP